jgi:hypothetical protein
MQTENFIRLLTADQHVQRVSIERALAAALAVGFAVSAVLFWITLGPRDDIAAAATTPRFVAKIVESLLLAAAAAVLTVRLMRPGLSPRMAAMALIAAPALLAAAVIVELLFVPPAQWWTKLYGNNALICITAIPLLALPILATVLWAVRLGAPTRPAAAGAVAGILAGGLAAALYAVQCDDDSPLFVAVWYSLAIAAVGVAGAIAGRRLFHW